MFFRKSENKANKHFVSAVILAAGSGSRMNSEIKKQYMDLNDMPVIAYSLRTINSSDYINEIILVVSEEDIIQAQDIVKAYKIDKVTKIVTGGDKRQQSTYKGFLEVNEACDFILVHDAARPLIDINDLNCVIEDAVKFGAAALGVKSKDTVKMTDENNFVTTTLKRERCYIIQTPQVIRKDLFKKGFLNAEKNNLVFTDDVGMLEPLGINVKITDGSYSNIKITTMDDLIYVRELIDYQSE